MLIEDEIDLKRVLREIHLLRNLKSKHILKLLNLVYQPLHPPQVFGDVYLVIQNFPTDLFKVIRSDQELTDQHVQFIMYQLCSAVNYMHSANVIHRDIKPSNILTNEDCEITICDFGLARKIEEVDEKENETNEMTEYVITRYYRAPEVMLSS